MKLADKKNRKKRAAVDAKWAMGKLDKHNSQTAKHIVRQTGKQAKDRVN